MPNTPRQSTPLVLGATLASLLLVSGCSTINDALGGDKVDYRTSGAKTVRLDVPPDLSQLPGQVRYNQLPSASISASTLTRAEAAATSGQTSVAVATKGGVKLERQGQNRWLVVDQPADKVWNQVSKFWEDNGFSLAVNQPEVGVMETTWAENRAKVPKDGLIRQTLGRVFDMLYDTGERDMYRTRIERTANGTEVYVTHRGMSEEYEDSKKERTTWRTRPSDPGLEAEMLSRLMIVLGGTQEEADALKRDSTRAAAAPATTPNIAQLNAQGNGLTVAADPDTTWRRVGLALDRSGFTVENRDRLQGSFEVRLSANDPTASKPGFFSRLFGADDKSGGGLSRYQVKVQGQGNNSVVNVLDEQGKA
ncbi:MAG: outer membrane protein assembly factor BamC, partial [Aquabacterium sp.]